MSSLILMRHGNTFEKGEAAIQVGVRTDLPLTSFGKSQAQKMLHFLQREKISPDAVYSGSLKRQLESAEIVANGFGLNVIYEPALNELDYGLWEGLTPSEIERRWPKEYNEWADGKWQEGIFRGTQEEHLSKLETWLEYLRNQKSQVIFACTSNGLLRLFKNEKVKTGHYCEIDLLSQGHHILSWNVEPHRDI